MARIDTRNFVLLSQALKDLPKQQKTTYSLIGSMGGGGLGGIVPAYALGRAELSRIRAAEAKKKLEELTEETENKSGAAQSLYRKSGQALVNTQDDEELVKFVNSTRDEVNTLGLKPVTLLDGTVVLPGAIGPGFSTKISEATLGEAMQAATQTILSIVQGVAQANEANNDAGGGGQVTVTVPQTQAYAGTPSQGVATPSDTIIVAPDPEGEGGKDGGSGRGSGSSGQGSSGSSGRGKR